jgi:branched-chain amino acid transport system substrate-binding protein
MNFARRNSTLLLGPILSGLLLLNSCTTAPSRPKPAAKTNPIAQKEFQTAKANLKSGNPKRGLAQIRQFAQANPNSELTGEAHFILGQAAFDAQNYSEAFNQFNEATKLEGPYADISRIRAARALARQKRIDEAQKLFDQAAAASRANPGQDLSVELALAQYEISAQNKHNFEAMQALLFLADKYPVASERARYKQQAVEILENRLSEDDLRKAADSSSLGPLQVTAKYRYALVLLDQQQNSRAQSYLADVMRMDPQGDLAERSKQILLQLEARQKVEPHTVGVVLPLTGKQASIGYKTLQGIQLGLGIYGRNSSSLKLAVIDSEGNPDSARRAVERLVSEDNVIAIIGGVLSKTATAEASKAQEFGIPFIALSQKAGITQVGPSVFRNALTSQMQVRYLVQKSMDELHLTKFAVLFPNDPYGVEYANLFWDEVRARGGSIEAAQTYDPKEVDFRGTIQRMVGSFYLEDRGDEYRARIKAWQEKNPKHTARTQQPNFEEILPPIIDFQAIFIPDSAKALNLVAPFLAYADVDHVKLLGTNLWNTSSVLQKNDKALANTLFVDSFLATDPHFQTSEFFTGFKQIFDEEPGIFELQGYDSALILRQILTRGEGSRAGVISQLSQIKNFPGALGQLNVTADREIQRPLLALTAAGGKIQYVESATRQ